MLIERKDANAEFYGSKVPAQAILTGFVPLSFGSFSSQQSSRTIRAQSSNSTFSPVLFLLLQTCPSSRNRFSFVALSLSLLSSSSPPTDQPSSSFVSLSPLRSHRSRRRHRRDLPPSRGLRSRTSRGIPATRQRDDDRSWRSCGWVRCWRRSVGASRDGV